MTLIEVIIALAVLGIVTVPLLVVFTNAQVVIKKTESRLETNAVMRIVKENVTRAVKYGGEGSGNNLRSCDGAECDLTKKENGFAGQYSGQNLEVKSEDGKINEQYKFDAGRTKDFGEIAAAGNTCEYEITLKEMDGTRLQRLKILVNRLEQ